jgi:hypothetical protein
LGGQAQASYLTFKLIKMVGYRCKSNFKDIEGNIINQGDYVAFKEYDRIDVGRVDKIEGWSVIIKGGRWTRNINGTNTDRFILILKKNKDYEEND